MAGCWAAGECTSRQQLRPFFPACCSSRSLSEAALVVKPVGLHLERENKSKGGILSTQHM